MSKNKFKILCCMVIMILICPLFLNYINKGKYGKNPKYGDFKISLLNNNKHVNITEEEKNEIFNYIVNELENEEYPFYGPSLRDFDLAKGKAVKIDLKNNKFKIDFSLPPVEGKMTKVSTYRETDKIYIDLDKRITNCSTDVSKCSTPVSEDLVEFLDKYFN